MLLVVLVLVVNASLFAQVSGISASVAYGNAQCNELNSSGQFTSSYVTVGLSHLRL